MSGVGFSELIILALIGLIVLGPEKLPRVANRLGNWIGQARRMTRVMRRQLEDELDFDENLNPKKKTKFHEKSDLKSEPAAHSGTPLDDDTYSPVHVEESNALSATVDELASAAAEESASSDDESDVTGAPVTDDSAEKSA